MEAFRALMAVYLGIGITSLVILTTLYRATKFKPSLYMAICWLVLVIDAALEGFLTTGMPVPLKTFIFYPHKILVHFLQALTLAQLVNLKLPLKKIFWALPFLLPLPFILERAGASSELYPMTSIIPGSFLLFYTAYQVWTKRKTTLTICTKALCVLYVLFGIHMYDYAYFYTRPQLFLIGFTIAILFLIAQSILIPAALIERIASENSSLETKMQLQAKMSQASKMETLGQMAGGIAHELNNPLAIISLNLESMQQALKKTVDIEQFNTRITKSLKTVERMSHIVSGLLTFAREDKSVFKHSKVSVDELIDDTLMFVQRKIESYGIELKILRPEKPVFFIGNKPQLSQVLINLVGNSFDSVKELDKKWIHLEASESDSEVIFSVTDSGSKIPENIHEQLFRPFFTTKEIGQGTGLGLSISKGIIDAHRGEIFHDAKCENTKFTFKIPNLK